MSSKIDYATQLRHNGLKSTPLRKALLEFIYATDLPIDAINCAKHLQEINIPFDPANIYRNLENFVQKGLIKKVDLQDGKYYYEKISDCSHLICNSCGKVEHIHDDQSHALAHRAAENTGFAISQHVSDFFGICKQCQS